MGGKSNNNGPDMTQAAIQQGAANRQALTDQTYANRPTQYTPWGVQSWQANPYTDPGTGDKTTQWTQSQQLTPELQNILDKQIAIQGGRTDIAGMLTGRMGSEFGRQMDWSGLTPMGEVPTAQFTLPEGELDSPYKTRQRAEDAVYNSAMSRLTPQFQGENASLELKMRNQGLRPGDAAWQSQMNSLGRKQTDQQQQAQWGATQAGQSESAQMFGQGLAANQNTYNQALGSNQQNFGQAMQQSQYATALRQQQMSEAMQKRGFSLNEINALLSGQQVGMPQMPSFTGAQQATPAPIYQAAADTASIKAANDPMKALIGAGGTIGGAYAGKGS